MPGAGETRISFALARLVSKILKPYSEFTWFSANFSYRIDQ